MNMLLVVCLSLPTVASPAVSAALTDEDPSARATAVKDLGLVRFGVKPDVNIRSLIRQLRDPDPYERGLAANTLKFYPPAALAAAAPALTRVLHNDPDPSVRRQAAISLGSLGPPGKAAVPLLVETLKEKPTTLPELFSSYHLEAVIAVGRLGPAAEPAVPALAEMLQDPRPWVRAAAALNLGQVGPAAKAAVPDLRRALKDREPQARSCAAITLWHLERRAKEPLPVLTEALQGKDRDDPRRFPFGALRQMVETLGEMGREAKEAAAALVPLLKEKEDGVGPAAAAALKRIDPEAAKRAGVR
jgi:HEAT repeat protein